MNASLTIVDRDTAPRDFGAAFRPSRPGPEQELVEEFLDEEPFLTPEGYHATIFCEPRIESGFPDLVIVLWDKSVTEKWVPKRAKLQRLDIQLMHYL
jgi:hypothetical protein